MVESKNETFFEKAKNWMTMSKDTSNFQIEANEDEGSPSALPKPQVASIEDYQIMKQVGKGAFGKVFLAQNKLTQEYVAIKTLAKSHVEKTGKTENVVNEKNILLELSDHPFMISLK